jgi:hypothetical protein
MSIERVFYCDWRECERHVKTASTRPAAFITLSEGYGPSQHYCGWDCVLKQAAEKPPAEVISFEDAA